MSDRIETLMRNSASTHNGWTKMTTTNNEILRSIRIGSQTNCNEDGMICDPTTYSKIKTILDKYNIVDYKLEKIQTECEYSTLLMLPEENYNELIVNLN